MPDENRNGSSETPTPESTNSSSVREFLYLDQPKLLSYLSQIHGGLQLLVEQVERQFRSHDNTTPEQKRTVEAAVEAELLGKIPFLVEGTVAPSYKESRETATGGDKVSTGRLGQRASVSTLHHEALELVERHLGDRLVKISGDVQFIDFDSVLDTIKDFPDFIKNFNTVTGQKLSTPSNTKGMHYLVSKSSRGRVAVLLRSPSGKITTSYLQKQNLTTDPQSIVDNYGIRLSGQFTLVGIDATPPTEIPDFSPTFMQAHEDGEEMGRALVQMVQQLEHMLRFWQLKSKDSHIYPIAIYREL